MKIKACVWAALLGAAQWVGAAANPDLAPAAGGTNVPVVTPALTNANPVLSETALFGDPVIVQGKGFQIKRSDLDILVSRARSAAAAQGQQLDPEHEAQLEVQFLEELITIQVLSQKVTPADKVVGEQQAEMMYSNIVTRAGSPDRLERQLRSVGLTLDEWRRKGTEESTAMAVLERLLGVFVTDVEVHDYYSNHTADFEVPETAQAQEILLLTVDTNSPSSAPLPANVVAQKRALLQDIIKRARAGEDFGTLAKQYSEDVSTRDNGGELPRFARGRLPAEFESAVFSMTNNQVSDVVEVSYGLYAIHLIKKYPPKLTELSQVASQIKDILTHNKLAKQAQPMVDKLKAEEEVQIVDPKLRSLVDLVTQPTSTAPAAGGAAATP